MNGLSVKQRAHRWRVAEGYVGRGGVVVIYEREVQGWVDCLRNPEHWVPGCVAVDEDGCMWIARECSYLDGADYWELVK